MLTLKKINDHLLSLGHQEVLVRGDDYFYFADGDAPYFQDSMVCMSKLNDLTLEQWVSELDSMKESLDE